MSVFTTTAISTIANKQARLENRSNISAGIMKPQLVLSDDENDIRLLSPEQIPVPLKNTDLLVKKLDSVYCQGRNILNPSDEVKYAYSFKFDHDYRLTQKSSYTWSDDLQQFFLSSLENNSFNLNGQLDLKEYKSWDYSTQTLMNDYKREYTYVYNKKYNSAIGCEKYYDWDTVSQNWTNTYKEEFEYDAEGYLLIRANYRWNEESQSFCGITKASFQNNVNGNPIIIFMSTWSVEKADWIIKNKYLYEYDKVGNLISMENYLYLPETDSWIPKNRTEYTYTASGLISSQSYLKWNSDSLRWVENERHEYIYDKNDQEISHRYYLRNSLTNEMQYNSYTEVSFDNNGNTSLYKAFSVIDSTGKIAQTQEDVFKHNSFNDMVSRSSSFYDFSKDTLIPFTRIERDYNDDFSYENILLPEEYNDTDLFSHMVISNTEYDWDESLGWIVDMTSKFFYSDMESGMQSTNFSNQKPVIYPNPTTGQITINLRNDTQATFDIYNALGNKVKTRKLIGQHSNIDLDLNSGVYFYHLFQNGKYTTNLLIVR